MCRQRGLSSGNDGSVGRKTNGGHGRSGTSLDAAVNGCAVRNVKSTGIRNLGDGRCVELQSGSDQSAIALLHGNVLEANCGLHLVGARHVGILGLVRLDALGLQIIRIDVGIGSRVLMSNRGTSASACIGTKSRSWSHSRGSSLRRRQRGRWRSRLRCVQSRVRKDGDHGGESIDITNWANEAISAGITTRTSTSQRLHDGACRSCSLSRLVSVAVVVMMVVVMSVASKGGPVGRRSDRE